MLRRKKKRQPQAPFFAVGCPRILLHYDSQVMGLKFLETELQNEYYLNTRIGFF